MCRMSSLMILFLVGFCRCRDFYHNEVNLNGNKISPDDLGLDLEKIEGIATTCTNGLKKYGDIPYTVLAQKDPRQLFPLDLNTRIISNCISGGMNRFFHSLGIIKSNGKNGRTSLARMGQFDNISPNTLRDTIIHELFAFVQKLFPIGEQITSSIENHLHEDGYSQKGYSQTQLSLANDMTRAPRHILRLLTYVDNTEFSLGAYLHCLNTTVTPFDLTRALAKLVRHPPQTTRKIVTLRLSKPIPNNPNTHEPVFSNMIAMTCRVLVENPSRGDFENCLKQVVMVNQCVEDLADKNVAAITQSNLQSNKQLTRNIKVVNTSCDVIPDGNGMRIQCNPHLYRNFDVSLLSLTEKIFGKSFITSVASRNVVRKLGNLVMKNEWGSNVIQEVNDLVEIYQEAARKKQYLLRRSKNDPRVLRQYKKHSRQLARYTKNLSDIAMNVVGHIRGITSTIEEALIQTATTALGFDLSNNFRALRRCETFWNNLKTWLDYNFNQEIKPKPQNWQDFFGVNRSLTRNNDQNLSGNNLKRVFNLSYIFDRDWFTSMQSIVRTIARRKPSTIMTLANTFLLATMFYEFIVILAGAIYQSENTEDTTTQPTIPLQVDQPNGNSDYLDFGMQEPIFRRKRAHQIPWRDR